VRIIAGEARGRKLKPVPGADTRPTSDRVKESLFNIIQFHIEGRRVLDLFAGSGQLGAEALSRGARECVFVEQSAAAAAVIAVNTEYFGSRAVIRTAEVLRWLESGMGSFDLVLMDPPYGSKLAEKTLVKLFARGAINPGGFIICECGTDTEPVEPEKPFVLKKVYEYGNKRLLLYENSNMSGQL
jgi:16S rRNA (guanine(966)-N(2))-methyltransferase RsmD